MGRRSSKKKRSTPKSAKIRKKKRSTPTGSQPREQVLKRKSAAGRREKGRPDIARQMLDANPDRMSLADKHYIYRDVNRSYLESHRCSRKDIIGKHVAEFLGREVFERTVKPHFDECLTGKQVRYESWFEFPSGRKYQDVIYNPHYDSDGRVAGVIVTARDITQVQLAREALQFAGDCLNLIGSTVEEVVWVTDGNTGKSLYVSAAYERIWGRPLQELYQTPRVWMDAVHPEDRTRLAALMEKLQQHGRIEAEYRIIRPNGEIRWIRDVGATVLDTRNQVRRNVGIAQDITEIKRAEKALDAERRRLRAFLQNSLLNAWMKDEDGRYVYVSDQTEECFKFGDERWKGQTDFDLWPREIAEGLRRNDLAVLKSGEAIEAVEKMIHSDGSVSWWLANKFPFQDEDGRRYVGGLGVNITAMKQAQSALDIERRRLNAFLNNSLVIAWMKDEDGRLVYMSRNCEKHFRVRFEEWKDKSDFELWPREIAEKFRRNDLIVLNANKPIETVEEAPNPDGGVAWFLNNKFPFQDQDGRRYVGGLGVDITKMRWAEEERQKFVLLADQSHDFIGICDCQFTPVYLNPAGRRIVGLEDQESFHHLTVGDFFFHEDVSLVMDEFMPRVQRDGHGEIEIRMKHFKTGEPIWMLHEAYKICDSSSALVGWATIGRDITERKQADEARQRLKEQEAHAQKLEAVGTLAAGMAHDVNTLFTVILGNAQLIQSQMRRKEKMNTALMSEELGAIVDAVDRGKTFLDKLLTLGRIRSSKLSSIDLNSSIRDTLHVVRSLITQNITVNCRLAPDLRYCVGDTLQMQQVAMNLIKNAIDAMPHGGTLTIQTENAELPADSVCDPSGLHRGNYVCLTIGDTGVGMDQKTIERLFVPYYSTKFLDKGTGLGLSIVYAIVKQTGGHITVDSEVGKGTSFRVYIPESC